MYRDAGDELVATVPYARSVARVLLAVSLAVGCAQNAPPPHPRSAATPPEVTPALVWAGPSDGALPVLRRRFRLHELVDPSRPETEQLVRVRDWVHHRWAHHSDNTPPHHDTVAILEAAAAGERFRCVEYALVLAEVYRALGWHARFVRLQGKGGAHAVTEVYVPSLGKWALMDGQHAALVRLGVEGPPASAWELVEALRRRAEGSSSSSGSMELAAEVRGQDVDYLLWMSDYLDYVMVPELHAYGRQLERLRVLARPEDSGPEEQPPYLRRIETQYRVVYDPALLYQPTPPAPGPSADFARAHRTAPSERTLRIGDMAADLDELARLLESAHPDPFLRGGGRIAFARRVDEIRRSLPPNGGTSLDLLRLVRPLVASVGDGHTTIGIPGENASQGARAWIDFDIVDDHLYVAAVFGDADLSLVGATLVSVEGIAVGELAGRMARLRGADNAYGNLVHVADAFGQPNLYGELVGAWSPPAAARIELQPPRGPRVRVELPFAVTAPGPRRTADSALTLPASNAADLAWGWLDAGRSIGYLRIGSAARYREAFEVWRSTGYERNLGQHLTDVARAARGGTEPPASVDARIALVPSATTMFVAARKELAEAQASTLVVDVRDNRGGNSAIGGLLTYFLFDGSPAVSEGYQVPRYSDLFFQNHGSSSLTKVRERSGDASLRVGDFDFAGKRGHEAGAASADREVFAREAAAHMPTFATTLGQQAPSRPWKGRVIVVTSARTYSAGLDIAMHLVRYGATVVGVPSGQAPTCFIDSLGYRLEHSGLGGSISYKWSVAFPGEPNRQHQLSPDVGLDRATLLRMQFDPNAAVRLAVQVGRGRPGMGRVK
jgi:hypothetical protein